SPLEKENSSKLKTTNFYELKKAISIEKKAVNELNSSFNHFENARDKEEKKTIEEHINRLKNSFKKINEDVLGELEKINLAKPLKQEEKPKPRILLEKKPKKPSLSKKFGKELSQLEKETIKRIRSKKEKFESKEIEKPKKYTEVANRYFYNSAKKLSKDKNFDMLKRDLIRTNLEFTPITYISVTLLTTAISVIVAFVFFLFFFFFKIGGESSMISIATENFGMRFLKTFWILFAVPIGTFLFMYFYPSLEKKSTESRINQELPFSVIHMSAISESMIEPSKIFSIIITTKEYPYIEREFTKLINEINIYGYDLISALRNTALNSPSKKLAELFNGLAITINSGGDLTEFFNKRSQTLLFEYRLEREKGTKTAETFMDIYISVVIAAPMILMLLLMMMKISGLGIALGTSSITLMMILAVSVINIAFISFLHLRKPAG
ncbi:type II secretion system F family protein, partial [Candidatus Pacearchaeota archaeon]|nr:type II secretion system F family protein [Candidatus Pacearchaeota archaeon]